MVADLHQVKRAANVPFKEAPKPEFGAVKLKDRTIHYGKIGEVVYAGKSFVSITVDSNIRLIDPAEVSQLMTVAEQESIMLKLTTEQIIHAVCDFFKVDQRKLLSRKRTDDVCRVRFYAFKLAREAGYSLSAIGRAFDRDHGAIVNGIRSIDAWIETDTAVKIAFSELRAAIGLNKLNASTLIYVKRLKHETRT